MSHRPVLESPITERMSPNIYECFVCKERFWLGGRYQKHMLMHNISVDTYACNICQMTYFKKQQLERHLKSHLLNDFDQKNSHKCENKEDNHENVISEGMKIEISPDDGDNCEIVNSEDIKTSPNDDDQDIHAVKKYKISSQVDLKQENTDHIQTEEKKSDVQDLFSWPVGHDKNNNKDNVVITYACDDCPRKCFDKLQLELHMQSHRFTVPRSSNHSDITEDNRLEVINTSRDACFNEGGRNNSDNKKAKISLSNLTPENSSNVQIGKCMSEDIGNNKFSRDVDEDIIKTISTRSGRVVKPKKIFEN